MKLKNTFFTLSIITIIVIFICVITLYVSINGLKTIKASGIKDADTLFSIAGNELDEFSSKEIIAGDIDGDFYVYKENELLGIFRTYDEAKDYASSYSRVSIKQKGITNILWNNYPQYIVYISTNAYEEFEKFEDACAYANNHEKAYVYYRGNNSLVYEKGKDVSNTAFIMGVPLILQLPELPRGCEVTSLAMLINYMGISVDKMKLANEIVKNSEPIHRKNGKIYAGHPNDGFIGSMTSFDKFGLGVYHKPIYNLLKDYFPEKAIDLTGDEFEEIYKHIHHGSPVWVIINSQYKALPKNAFERWETPNGSIDITYKEHSVIITGYDDKKIYFNDPLGSKTSADKADFIKAWRQMGSQAVTVIK